MGLVDYVSAPLRRVVMAFRHHEEQEDEFDQACLAVKRARDDLDATITELTHVSVSSDAPDDGPDQD